MTPPDGPGTLLISLDFELYWGLRDQRTLQEYRANLLGVRTAVPALLELFGAYGIHATWCTVGFLFFESLQELLQGLPAIQPGYKDPRLSPYGHLGSVRENEEEDPFHFAPSLIRKIAESPFQEVASHTFSHYYCLEEGQTAETFEEDLHSAARAAQKHGLRLESLAFPRNQVHPPYLPACARAGIRSFRGTERSWLYRPRGGREQSLFARALRLLDAYLNLSGHNAYPAAEVQREPLVNLPSSRFLRPYSRRLRLLEPLRLRRILSDLTYAAKNRLVYHLWWHPHNFGADTQRNLSFLEKVLRHYVTLRARYGLESLNMRELCERLAGPAG